MRAEFQLARFGAGDPGELFTSVPDVMGALGRRLDRIGGPYSAKEIGGAFGPDQDLEDTVADIALRLEDGEQGLRVIVRGADHAGPKIVLRKLPAISGAPVLDYAFSQLGVEYVFGDENPKGPEGGPGSAFDCSGLVKWCYAQVDVELPPGADLIMHDPILTTFDDPSKLRPGDMIFYSYGGGSTRHADHIALFAETEQQVAASSAADRVTLQPIDWPHEIKLGFVSDVTGAH